MSRYNPNKNLNVSINRHVKSAVKSAIIRISAVDRNVIKIIQTLQLQDTS